MKINNIYRKTLLASGILAGTALITGCSSDDTTPGNTSVRIIHASSDAPPVDIKLNDDVAVSALDYPQSTGFVSIKAGIYDVAVDAIVPGGNLEVINVQDLGLATNQRYTVVALDDTADITEFLAEESAASPADNEVAIAVLHAATAAGNVDVYVTAPDASLADIEPTFTFDFKGQIDAGALPAGEYQIRVVANGDNSKQPVYDSGTVDLGDFAGQKLMLLAVNTVNATAKASSPVKLVAYTDSAQRELLDSGTQTGARVVHLSPNAPTVDVFASSSALETSPAKLIDSISYAEVQPAANSYAPVPAGSYTFDVVAQDDPIQDSVFTSPGLPLAAGGEYTVIAAGLLSMDPQFDLWPTQDNNRAIVTQASVKVVHGSPAAGPVDVFVTPANAFTKEEVESGAAGAPLLDDFEFGTITDYVAVPPGDYDIRVVTEGGAGTAAIDEEDVTLAPGSVSTVIAREPVTGGGEPSTFGLVVLSN